MVCVCVCKRERERKEVSNQCILLPDKRTTMATIQVNTEATGGLGRTQRKQAIRDMTSQPIPVLRQDTLRVAESNIFRELMNPH